MKKSFKGLFLIVTVLCVLCMTVCALADADVYGSRNRLTILSQPADVTVGYNSNVWFTVNATGDGLTYQWMYRPATGAWRNVTSYDGQTSTICVSATPAMNGYQYRCVVQDAYRNKVYTNNATLYWSASYTPYVAPTATPAPTYYAPALRIVTQPANQTVRPKTNATFTVAAEGDGVNYLWQMRAPGTNWTTIGSGSQYGSWTLYADTAVNGYEFRCIVSDKTGAAIISSTAVLTVTGSAAPVTAVTAITTQPVNAAVNRGTQAYFTVGATGNGLIYQWQVLGPNSYWTSVNGARASYLTVNAQANMNGYRYRCVIRDASGSAYVTAPVLLTVY